MSSRAWNAVFLGLSTEVHRLPLRSREVKASARKWSAVFLDLPRQPHDLRRRLHEVKASHGERNASSLAWSARSTSWNDAFHRLLFGFTCRSPRFSGSPDIFDEVMAFDTAQQLALTRAKRAVGARNVKAAELVTGLEMERAYVQSLADASPEQAPVIIEAAGMIVAGTTTYVKPFLRAKQDVPSGAVHVFFNAGVLAAGATGKVLYEWQSSSDGGTTWISAPLTPYGHMAFEGLIPTQSYGFRVRFADRKGAHGWSQVLTYVVQ
ncbi:MAG: hypothetical protein U0359_38410 [Byssovorax sp.]